MAAAAEDGEVGAAVDQPILEESVFDVWGGTTATGTSAGGEPPDDDDGGGGAAGRVTAQLTACRITATAIILCVRDGTTATLDGQLAACAPRTPTDAPAAPSIAVKEWTALARALALRRIERSTVRPRVDRDSAAVVFTAPHCLEVVRPGEPWHRREDYTGTIAKTFALCTSGAYIRWRQEERDRVQALVRSRGGSAGQGPDDSNADPNYVDTALVVGVQTGPTTSENGWTHTLVQARPAHQTSALHVDLHGMARVGTTECILGLGAMRAVDPQRADQFHAALVHHVATLPLFGGDGTGLIVGKPGDRLQGCWGKKLQRCSLTQQACTAAAFPAGSRPYTHAVQVEMTMDLRKRLVHNHDEAEAFATALVMAFRSCCAEAGVPS